MPNDLQSVKGIGSKTEEKLNELKICDILELLCFLPSSYVDLDKIVTLSKTTEQGIVLLVGQCCSITKSHGYGEKQFFKAVCYSGDYLVSVIWYNMPYLSSSIIKGETYKFFGKIIKKNEVFEMINPLFENVKLNKKLFGIMPIYKLKGLIAQTTFRTLVNNALTTFETKSIVDIYEKNENNSLKNALYSLHNRTSDSDIDDCKYCLSEDMLLSKILSYRILKSQSAPKPFSYDVNLMEKIDELKSRLPYNLTPSQQSSLDIILGDMNAKISMNRLLSGDVGSGKTIIAILTAYYAAMSGKQVAYLAPTEILAVQTYTQFCALIGDLLSIGLLTSSQTAAKRREIISALEDGTLDIVIGTTSVLSAKISFSHLSYIVIDESHRFGVAGRATLEGKGDKVDILVMTATPIPRSLSMLMYGEMEDTYIERRDNLSEKIKTTVTADLDLCWDEVLREIEKGNQAYIVCPMIEDNEGCELYAAKTLFEELSRGYFAQKKVGLLFGNQKDKEKSKQMVDFYEGKTDILVSTTVIEVGINCPNATIIVIMNSERFGLATLHQLRGRVGRGDKLSKCYLVTKSPSNPRLLSFSSCYDGMEIAELDYSIRGGGEYFGLSQSGDGDERCGYMPFTREIILEVKSKADKMLLSADFKTDFINSPQYKIQDIMKKITLN